MYRYGVYCIRIYYIISNNDLWSIQALSLYRFRYNASSSSHIGHIHWMSPSPCSLSHNDNNVIDVCINIASNLREGKIPFILIKISICVWENLYWRCQETCNIDGKMWKTRLIGNLTTVHRLPGFAQIVVVYLERFFQRLETRDKNKWFEYFFKTSIICAYLFRINVHGRSAFSCSSIYSDDPQCGMSRFGEIHLRNCNVYLACFARLPDALPAAPNVR